MSEKPPLTDDEVYERLHAAWLALGREDGQTNRGDTSVKAARQALVTLQLGLLAAMDQSDEQNRVIIDPTKLTGP